MPNPEGKQQMEVPERYRDIKVEVRGGNVKKDDNTQKVISIPVDDIEKHLTQPQQYNVAQGK